MLISAIAIIFSSKQNFESPEPKSETKMLQAISMDSHQRSSFGGLEAAVGNAPLMTLTSLVGCSIKMSFANECRR